MDTRYCADLDVIKDAERILFREKWQVCEERAAQRLAEAASLKWTPAQRQPMDRHRDRAAGPCRRLRHLPRRRPGLDLEGPALVIRIAMTLAKQMAVWSAPGAAGARNAADRLSCPPPPVRYPMARRKVILGRCRPSLQGGLLLRCAAAVSRARFVRCCVAAANDAISWAAVA